ncbi:MAG: glycosyltransferase [Candidatus Dependentiae bacterium]|nr:glycosyltransferase [Candidatus Dependentiae bacterium]
MMSALCKVTRSLTVFFACILLYTHYVQANPQAYSYRYALRHRFDKKKKPIATTLPEIQLDTDTFENQFIQKTPEKPKLLFVETYFPPVTSTAALNQLTCLLDSNIFDITIYAKQAGSSSWANPDIKKYNLFKSGKVFIGKLPPNMKEFDIILCQFGYRGTELIDIKKQKGLQAKVVTCFRGSDLTKHVKKNPRMYDYLFQKGDLFLPVCNYFQQKLIDMGCNPKKIKVMHSTIDCNKFKFKPRAYKANEPIKITTVCRLVEKKGVEYSIKAIEQLVSKYPEIELSIIGFGPLESTLKKMVAQSAARNNIKFLGRCTEQEVIEILGKTHIFILPCVTASNGDSEGIPNACKESMATGKPTISTFNAGISELIDNGISGFLVPEKDSFALAQKIEYLIKNPQIWHTMGLAARNKVLNMYDKTKENQKLIILLNSLLPKNKKIKIIEEEQQEFFPELDTMDEE